MSEEERDYEEEARKEGWVDSDEWKGDPDRHVTAQRFVERGEEINGFLKKKVGRLEERIDSLTQSNAEFKQYTDKQLDKEHKKSEQLIEQLEQVKAQAITDGDGAAAVKAEKDIQILQQEPQQQKPDPELERMSREWGEKNSWYGTDKELTEYAEFIYPRIIQDGFKGQGYFDELDRRIQKANPEKFKNTNRDKASAVESGGTKEASNSEARTWTNLPPEAKAAAKRFEKDIPGFKRDDYVATYEWESK